MAIGVTNVQTSVSASFSYTPDSVTDSVLVVVVSSESTGNEAITGMTFGATAMIQAVQEDSINFSPVNRLAIFYLKDPGTSAETIDVTGPLNRIGYTAMTLSNVDQTTPLDASASKDDITTVNNIDLNITTTNDGSLIIAANTTNASPVRSTAQGSQVEISDFDPSSSSHSVSREIKVTAGLENQGFNLDTSVSEVIICLAAFNEVAVSAAAKRFVQAHF